LKRPICSRLFAASALSVLLLAGCTTTGPAKAPMIPYDPGKPHTLLPGANMENAKSVAMGAAVSNGWKIVDSSGNRLLLQRTLDTPDPQITGVQVPGAKPPLVQAQAAFFPRTHGVEVTVGAELITNRGTKEEQKRHFTEAYNKDLMHSLASLNTAWAATAPQVANALPPLQTPGDLGAPPTAEESKEIAQTEGPGLWGPTNWGNEAAPASQQAAPASPPPPTGAQETAAPLVAEGAGAPPATADDRPQGVSMVAGNDRADTGVWAYYAEQYARAHGCDLTGQGAVLVEKHPEYEIHRVDCQGGQEFLLRCNAGSCEEMH